MLGKITTALLCAILLAACATPASAPPVLPTTPAPWAQTPQALRQLFPDRDYIAQRGRGKTLKAAEVNAAAEIARFFTRQISAQSSYRITATQTNGEETETLQTLDEAQVKTRIDLFGIRYADGAYYDGVYKEWHAAAYIERDEAWMVYAPRIQAETDAFLNLYNAADKENDVFKKALRFDAAYAYTRRESWSNTLLFGQLLHPQKMQTECAAARAALAALPQKIDNAKRGATVFIDCPVDFEGRVNAAFAAGFNAAGFAVASSRKGAAAVCAVTVTEGEQKREMGVFYHPSVRAELRGSSGVLAGFTVAGPQAQAITPDVAKRRAYTALAESVKTNFAAQFAAINIQ